jgi:hypothetical protein
MVSIYTCAGRIRYSCFILVGKLEGKNLIGRARRRYNYEYIEIILTNFDLYGFSLMKKLCLARFCANTAKNFQFHKAHKLLLADEQVSVSENFVSHSRMVNGRLSYGAFLFSYFIYYSPNLYRLMLPKSECQYWMSPFCRCIQLFTDS